MSFASWLSTLVQPRRRPIRNAARRNPRRDGTRLLLELLEDRFAPAAHTWTGGGADGLWSNAANWDTALTATEGTTENVTLLFPSGITNKSMTQDISGLIVDQMQFQADGYSVNVAQTLTLRDGFDPGLPVTLQIGAEVGTTTFTGGTITVAASSAAPEINASSNCAVNIGSVLAGTVGYNSDGSGTVTLSGANTFGGVYS